MLGDAAYCILFSFPGNHQDKADATVEGPQHFFILHVSPQLNIFEYRKRPDLRQADFRRKAIRDNAAEIAFYPTPCDMSHAVEIFLAEQFLNRFVIGRVGLHDLFDKCQAVYTIQLLLRHFQFFSLF